MTETTNIHGTDGRNLTVVLPERLKSLSTLAERYKTADDYNRPAVEFMLRKAFKDMTPTR